MTDQQFRRFFLIFAVVMAAAKLWLVNAHLLMATITPHDDLLFISQAENLIRGKWLGEYNQMTLIKGPFYPMFIALSYYLDIPLLAAQQILYAVASFLAVWALSPLIRQKKLLLLFYLFLLLNPFSYNYPSVGRVFRLGIYQSLGLLSLGCLVGMVIRTPASWKKGLAWSVATGLFLAAFWNTREESIWIAPSFALVLAFALFTMRNQTRRKMLAMIVIYLLPLGILTGANSWLKHLNYKHYGVRETIELETPQFEAAYGGLLRIKSKKWRQFFPVVHDVREQAYRISPAFREVKPYLDGPIGQKWQDLCDCPDLPAAFFIWAFRDSVAAAGHYQNGPETLKYYQQIGDEIDKACAEGTLDCRPRLTSLVPTWHKEYNALFFPEFYNVIKQIVSFRDASATTDDMISKGSRQTMLKYEAVTREKILTSKRKVLHQYPEYFLHLNKEKTRILGNIGTGYKNSIPYLFVLALLGFCYTAGVGLKRRQLSLPTMVSGAALAGMLSIAFILTLLAITSYSEIERAMHSAYPMVLLFIVSVCIDLISRWFPVRNAPEDPSALP